MTPPEKTLPSSLTPSSTEADQPRTESPDHRRNIPVPSFDFDIQPPAKLNNLFSVKSPDDGKRYNAGTGTGLRGVYGARRRRRTLESCTESLGFESLTEKIDSFDSSSSAESMSRKSATRTSVEQVLMRRERPVDEVEKDFPPFLTTLNINGRPRFEMTKARNNGRLEIKMIPSDKPVIVRSRGREGGLRMDDVNDDKDQEEIENSEDS